MICISNPKKIPLISLYVCYPPGSGQFHSTHTLEWLATYGQYKNIVEVRNTLYPQLPVQLYILLLLYKESYLLFLPTHDPL